MDKKTISYWIITVILALAVLSGGISQVTRQQRTIEGIMKLGYPLYFIIILGIWKVLGAIVILIPGFPRIKEWAYAGIFFEMTGAAISHAVIGNPLWHVAVTLVFAFLAIVSWAFRPQSRRLGVIFPSRTGE